VQARIGDGRANRALPLLLAGGIRHNMMPYLTAGGAPVKTAEELATYNLADPGVRIPFKQVELDQAVQLVQMSDPAIYRELGKQMRAGAIESLEAAFAGRDVLVSLNNYDSALYPSANYPAISVPFGLRANGMPVGVTFIGKPGQEAKLLSYAYAFEQATNARVNPDLEELLQGLQGTP
jgi:amidase